VIENNISDFNFRILVMLETVKMYIWLNSINFLNFNPMIDYYPIGHSYCNLVVNNVILKNCETDINQILYY